MTSLDIQKKHTAKQERKFGRFWGNIPQQAENSLAKTCYTPNVATATTPFRTAKLIPHKITRGVPPKGSAKGLTSNAEKVRRWTKIQCDVH